MTFSSSKWFLAAIIVVLSALCIFYLSSQNKSHPDEVVGDIHIHGDFKVFLNNISYNFSQQKYMSSENHTLNPFFHLHDMDGSVLHQHMSGVKIGSFFKSLGMSLNSTCFVLDNSSSYCNTNTTSLKMYIRHNGSIWQESNDFDQYSMSDLDQILITYGNNTDQETQYQMSQVTDRACIQSKKCPERGNSEDESSCSGNGPCKA